jgi:hypothetical protein
VPQRGGSQSDDEQKRDRHDGEDNCERRLGGGERTAADCGSESDERALLPGPETGRGGKLGRALLKAPNRLVQHRGFGRGARIRTCAAQIAGDTYRGAETLHNNPSPQRV